MDKTDQNKTWYLQSIGSIDNNSIKGIIWLGNNEKGKRDSLFKIKTIISTKESNRLKIPTYANALGTANM